MRRDIPVLDRKGLREFGLITGGILAGLFGLFFPWALGRPSPHWPWAVALLLSRITTPVIMSLVFFVIITPIALIMRLMGRDSMAQMLYPNAKSYRIHAVKL